MITACRQFLPHLKYFLGPKREVSGWKEYNHDLLEYFLCLMFFHLSESVKELGRI